MASQRAARKLMAWLEYCRSIGWGKESMPKLALLWWQHHDAETGELL